VVGLRRRTQREQHDAGDDRARGDPLAPADALAEQPRAAGEQQQQPQRQRRLHDRDRREREGRQVQRHAEDGERGARQPAAADDQPA
jgi:hypothetical protein